MAKEQTPEALREYQQGAASYLLKVMQDYNAEKAAAYTDARHLQQILATGITSKGFERGPDGSVAYKFEYERVKYEGLYPYPREASVSGMQIDGRRHITATRELTLFQDSDGRMTLHESEDKNATLTQAIQNPDNKNYYTLSRKSVASLTPEEIKHPDLKDLTPLIRDLPFDVPFPIQEMPKAQFDALVQADKPQVQHAPAVEFTQEQAETLQRAALPFVRERMGALALSDAKEQGITIVQGEIEPAAVRLHNGYVHMHFTTDKVVEKDGRQIKVKQDMVLTRHPDATFTLRDTSFDDYQDGLLTPERIKAMTREVAKMTGVEFVIEMGEAEQRAIKTLKDPEGNEQPAPEKSGQEEGVLPPVHTPAGKFAPLRNARLS